VQQRPLGHPREQVARDPHARQHGLGVLHALDRDVVGASDVWRPKRQALERALGGGLRRAPVDALHVHALALELVGEQVDADVRHLDRSAQKELAVSVGHRTPPGRRPPAGPAGQRGRCCG
jgi:hypothetical protein